MNEYYIHSSGQPIAHNRGNSAPVRAELDAIQAAFAKLPPPGLLFANSGAYLAQSGASVTAIDSGAVNAIVGSFTPAVTLVSHGMLLLVRAGFTNTATPTFKADSTAIWPVVKGNGLALGAGDIYAGMWMELEADATLQAWILKNPCLSAADGASNIGTTPAGNIASINVQDALNELDTEKYAANNPSNFAAIDQVQTFTKAQRGNVISLAIASNLVAVDLSLGNNFSLALQATTGQTLSNPNNAVAGQAGQIALAQNATPSTLAYGSNWIPFDGTTPIVSTTASAQNLLSYYVVDSTHIWFSLNRHGVA